eukprot:5488003-Amphidinium_carterae.1
MKCKDVSSVGHLGSCGTCNTFDIPDASVSTRVCKFPRLEQPAASALLFYSWAVLKECVQLSSIREESGITPSSTGRNL